MAAAAYNMTDSEVHLRNAPIMEAIIDIQFDGSEASIPDLSLDLAGYSKPESISMMAVSIRASEHELEKHTGPRHIGYRYVSEDEKHILQIRNDGFTFSQLNPYTDWRDFSQSARPLWATISPLHGAGRAKRIAVRYINRLLAPYSSEGTIVFKDFYSNAPDLPYNVEADVQHYLTRMVIAPNRLAGSVAVINQTIEGKPEEGCLPLILDIDVYVEGTDFALDDPAVWELLAELRVIKNDIFKGTMTGKALELCQ